MSDQTDPLTTVLADAIDAQNNGGGEQFAVNRQTMTAEIECYRLNIAALAQAIRDGFPNEYGVRDSRGIEVRGRMEARHLPGLASDWAEDGNPGELLARPVIPWHPIKENNQHD